jgi:hypothetical protein
MHSWETFSAIGPTSGSAGADLDACGPGQWVVQLPPLLLADFAVKLRTNSQKSRNKRLMIPTRRRVTLRIWKLISTLARLQSGSPFPTAIFASVSVPTLLRNDC